MKRRLFLVITLLLPFVLLGCTDGSWKDYKTPERFLKKAVSSSHRFSISTGDLKPREAYHKDYNFEVKDALSNAGGFRKTDLSSSRADRHFNYVCRYSDGLVGLSPALYCTMSVYDDGFINIHFETLKEDKDAYFEMDAERAYAINDLVIEKIQREEQILADDKKQAYLDGAVDNFLIAMEKKTSIKTRVYEPTPDNYGRYIYDFRDNGTILDLLKGLEYTRTDKSSPYLSREALIYNCYDENDKEPSWAYYLYDSGDYVGVYYHYENTFGEIRSVELSYETDATKGKEVLVKALELAKQ